MRTATALVDSNPEKVWRYLSVPKLMAGWMAGVDNLRTTDGGVIEAGARIQFEARGKTHQSHVDECVPLQTLVLTSTQGSFTATYRYALEPANGCTRITLSIDCSAQGMMRLIAPVISRLVWLSDKSQPARLKQVVESG